MENNTKRGRGRPRIYTQEESKNRTMKYIKEYQHKNQAARLWRTSKTRAKKCNIEFLISINDVQIPEICPILGIPITNIFGEGRVHSNASIDRIDSSKGYIPGNIQVISDLANRMKQNATKEQLIAFATGILKIYKKDTEST